ncbi:ATP phosphoribosyltransferase regulatory subunit [Thermaurantiacus sp.]
MPSDRKPAPGGPALLPEGFRDRLPGEAEAAAALLRVVVDTAGAHGYQRIQPPLVEFEAGLARWLGKPAPAAVFRASDPASGEALALRPDITGQVARIAATRLSHAPRPLRLAYAGPVLRAHGGMLDAARERSQAGAELIGTDSVPAVVEVLRIAIEALAACGVESLSVDLTLPELVEALARGPWPVSDWPAVARALDAKDWGALEVAPVYRVLLEATGEPAAALRTLRGLGLGPAFGALFDRIEAVARDLDGVRVTLDATERHGFEYQSWIGFSLFGAAGGVPFRGELGRGGSYRVRRPEGAGEPAVGFSLYIDPLAEAGLGRAERPRLFLPVGTTREEARRLRAEGYATVAALSADDTAERLGCALRFERGRIVG